MSKKLIEGAKAGSTPKQPFRERVTATTVQKAKILYGLTVGEARMFGVNPSQQDIMQRIYLDGTPIMDASGTKLLDVEVDYRNGTIDQTVIEGVPSVTLPQDVSLEVKYGIPLSRTMVTPNVTQYDIMLNIPQLFAGNAEGESRKGTVEIRIEIDNGDGVFKDYGTHTFNEKIINGFTPTITVDVDKAPTHTIRISKLTRDATDEYSANAVAVATITEVIAVHMAYPCTALLYLAFDAEQFNNIPKLEVRFFGVADLLIPANYNFDNNREYATTGTGTTGGVWDGTWKRGYCDNPIWHWLALATNKQWGLGNRITIDMIDKWELYRLAQYCDALVPDGKGGQEPRFTCNNVYLNTAEDAYKVFKDLCSLIRGATIYDGQWLRPRMDTPRDAVHIFSMANVQDLHYATVEDGAAHNVVHVQYFDRDNRFAQKVVTRRDEEDIRDRGSFFPLEVAAFGVTSEGQAQRAAEYILKSELTETNLISFTTGLEGISPDVGSVFLFADNYTAGKAISGRIKLISGRNVKLDREIGAENVGGTFIANTTQNKVVTRTILAVTGDTVVLDTEIETSTHPFLVWAIVTNTLAVPEYYVTDSSFDQATNTWSISGIQYSRKKYNEIDQSARVEQPPFTSIIPNGIGAPALVTLTYTNRVVQDVNVYTITAAWSDVANASAYAVEMRRDGEAWVSLGRMATLTYDIDNVYEGVYEVRVRAVDVLGNYSPYAISNPLNMRGKVLPPPTIENYTVSGVLFGYKHAWTYPAHTSDSRAVRIRYSDTDPVVTTNPVINYIDKAYPADTHEDTGIGAGVKRWFSIAIIDKYGVVGDYTMWHTATTSVDPDAIMELIKGHVGIEAIDDLLKAQIELANVNALEAINIANQTKQDTTAAVNELITDINTERDERLAQAAQMQDGIAHAQNTADGVVSDLTNYKASTNTTLANYQESINVLNNANASTVLHLNALDARMEGAETNVATALQQSQAAVNATNALSETVQANTAEIANKADSTYVDQVKVVADNANNVASTNATNIEALRSRVGTNESSINNINQTKANKDEVASIAQQALQSTWQADAQAKVDALNATVIQTYQTKADAESTSASFLTQLESKASVAQAQNIAKDAITATNIGGENLITGTQYFSTNGNLRPNYAGFGSLYDNKDDRLFGTNYIYLVSSSWSGFNFVGFPSDTLQEDCVLSFWASSQNNAAVDVHNIANGGTYLGTISGSQWKQYAFILPKGTKVTNNNNQGVVEFNLTVSGTVLAYGAIQLQRGNKATDWKPSPLDTKVGGRNILRNSEFKQGLAYWSIFDSQYTIIDETVDNVPTKYIYLSGGNGGVYMKPADQTYVAQAGDIMTISFYARGVGQMLVGFEDVNQLITLERNGNYFKRYSLTFKRINHDNVILYLRGQYVDLLKPKVELGNVATDWTPAPEDIENVVTEFKANVTNNYSTKADTTSAVASGVQEFNASLGNIKTFTAASSYNGFAGIRNGRGEVLKNTWRSYGLDVFNENGDWARSYVFDVYGNAALGDELAARINECVPTETIVVTTLDEPQGNRNAAMRAAFISIGGTGSAFDNIGYRNVYMLIGKKGLREGGGIEQLQSDGSIDFPMQFINGKLAAFSGSVGQQLQINANATLLTQTQAKVSEHDGQISSLVQQTTTLTSSVTQAQNDATKAKQDADLALVNRTEMINLTHPSYGQDTWYPVGIGGISASTRSNFSINAFLDNSSHPNWATHGQGFALNIQWSSIGSGWGTIPVDRVVNAFTYSWTANNVSPIIRQDQLGAASIEVVWLRGGANYYANFPKSAQIWMPDVTTGKVTDPSSGSTVDAILYTEAYMPKSVAQTTTTNTVTLQQQAQVIDGISANWTVKIDNNGYTTGFGLVSTPYGQGVLGAAMFNVDAFVVGKAGTNIRPFVVVADGQTVDGVYYPNSGAYFNASYHSFASIKLANIDVATIHSLDALSANLGSIQVGTANIADLSVDTIKIKDNAVTSLLDIRKAPEGIEAIFPPISAGNPQSVLTKSVIATGLRAKNRYLVYWRGMIGLGISNKNGSGYSGDSTKIIYFGSTSSTAIANSLEIGSKTASGAYYNHGVLNVGDTNQWNIAEGIVDEKGELCIWGYARWAQSAQSTAPNSLYAYLSVNSLVVLISEFKK